LIGKEKMKRAITILLLPLLLGGGFGLWWMLRTTPASKTSEELRENKANVDFSIEELERVLAGDNEEDRRQAVRTLFATLEASDIRRLQPRVEGNSVRLREEDDDRDGWILVNEFYRRWGEVAPEDALEFLGDHHSYWAGLHDSVYTAWARTNPDSAIAAYDPSLEDQYSREIQDSILEGVSEVDPVKALHFADAQEIGHEGIFDPENRLDFYAAHRQSQLCDFMEYVPVDIPADPFARAIYSWIRRDPQDALKEMLTLEYDSLQQATLGALFSNWLLSDPDAALAALPRIKDRYLREYTTHRAMQAYLLRHPQEALERILSLSEFENEYSGTIFSEETGSRSIPFRFCNKTPTITYDRMGLVSEAAVVMAAKDGRKAWDAVAAIKDDNERAAALAGALAGWMILDIDGATNFAAEGIREASFESIGGAGFPSYVARLVAKTHAQRDFKKATVWAESMPEGPLRDAAIKTAADVRLDVGWDRALAEASPEGWVQPDIFLSVQKREYAPVAEWLVSLPASIGRDGGMLWLVHRTEEHDDLRPALRYASLIEDPRLRRLSFESLAKELHKRKEKGEPGFDFQSWSFNYPELASELQKVIELKSGENGEAEQGGADQPATAPESKSEGNSKPQQDTEVRPQ
jgi:hypothetical protein